MTKEEFYFLHGLIKNNIQKENTQFRNAISTEERLAVCLRFLATGNSFRSMGFNYRMGFSTVRQIVIEDCDAIVMPKPTEELWKKSSARFNQLWNFPNCVAAINGKHINIQCPMNAGSTYYNNYYKGSHSIVLMALVDADYKFIAINVGSYGRNSDGGIFEKSDIGKVRDQRTLNVPADSPLEPNGSPQLHVIVGDEAFPLKKYLLCPYNYQEHDAWWKKNAFGILVARWIAFRRHLEVQPELVDKIVLACCCLHNMLCSDANEPDNITLHAPDATFQNLDGMRRNCTNEAFRVREAFQDFFNFPFGFYQFPPELLVEPSDPGIQQRSDCIALRAVSPVQLNVRPSFLDETTSEST
ncbi:hypothetical protein PPYR_04996 [Photinus pyralis]|uniref:DDE Tnp4 domain-containing protein n=1 Tax=Photinus pyralis TaxID=7054 RepID=A0A5N4B072_PHOPY|nr:hypothetical protein PPYR_04996 [Photinus pyralis]